MRREQDDETGSMVGGRWMFTQCICVRGNLCHVFVGAHRSQRVLDSLELELQTIGRCLRWVLAMNLGPLEEQQALINAEPSPWPQKLGIWKSHRINWLFYFG